MRLPGFHRLWTCRCAWNALEGVPQAHRRGGDGSYGRAKRSYAAAQREECGHITPKWVLWSLHCVYVREREYMQQLSPFLFTQINTRSRS